MMLTFALLARLAEGEGSQFSPIVLAAGGNLVWTILIFLVSLPLMWIVVMGPVTRALAARDEKAESAIAAAEKASREAEATRAKLEQSLAEAQSAAAKLLADARGKAEARGHELLDAAKAEAGALLDAARKAIRVEQDKAIAAIRNEVVDLSLHAATRVLERQVGSEDDRRFVAQIVAGDKAHVGRG